VSELILKGTSPVDIFNYFTLLKVLDEKKGDVNLIYDMYENFLIYNELYKSEGIIDHILINSSKAIKRDDLQKIYEGVSAKFSLLKSNDYIVKHTDDSYPKRLKDSKDYPYFLFCRGKIDLLFRKSVSVIGTRTPKDITISSVERVCKVLISKDLTVVSGLAKGIDSVAHRYAIEYGGDTIGVIGTPLNIYYPKENKLIQEYIEKEGLVISQYAPSQNVKPWFFLNRNDLMSVVSLMTIVMEASDRSGTLSQARSTLRNNRLLLLPKSLYDYPKYNWPKKFVKNNKNIHVFGNVKDLLFRLEEGIIRYEDN